MTTESNTTITEGKCEFTNAMVYTELSHDQKTLVDSTSERDRIKAAERGFGLDKLIDDECKVPDGCECIVKHLNTDYELHSEAYSSVKKGWTPEGNYDDVPCEYLEVTITFKDEDGDEETDSEVMEISEGWDYTKSEDYERLAKILCERNGFFFDANNWKD